MAKDYYQVLGVPRGADEATIRKAYRAKARELHPDVNPNDATAESRFKEVQEAYSVLSDGKKKAMYDRFGHAGVGRGAAGPSGWPPGGGGAAPDLDDLFGGGLGDIFESLFGGGVGGVGAGPTTRTRPRAQPRPTRLEQPVRVSLREAIHGAQRRVSSGGRSLEVTIPAGVREGSRVRVRKAGPSGEDLYLVVKLDPDSRFKLDGVHLRTKVAVDLYDALLGGDAQVPTPDGPVTLTIPAGTANGRVFRITGRGLVDPDRPGKRGDVLAKVDIRLPESLSKKERRLVEQLRAMRSDGGGGSAA